MRRAVPCLVVSVFAIALIAVQFWPDSRGPQVAPPVTRASHPLLGENGEAVLVVGGPDLRSTAGPELEKAILAVAGSRREDRELGSLKIDYPLDESIFPPDFVPPTFLWHDPHEEADTWLIDIAFGNDPGHIYVLVPREPPPVGDIDPRCITSTNQYQPTSYQASAISWTVGAEVWAEAKQCSTPSGATVTIHGFSSTEPAKALSCGTVRIATSEDPVRAPIFYRDVPLAPSETKRGRIMPLATDAFSLIAWRLRDISRPRSRLLLTDVPTCTNCHSFSADGQTMGMDLDGPDGDKGDYVIAPVRAHMTLEEKDVISWNSFGGKPKDAKTIGFLSQISPDGQYVVTTANESLYTENFTDYRFLQVFYPTRGILVFYSRATGKMKALGGANDTNYVHCDPVWSPDGEYLVFARARAKDPYREDGKHAVRAGDPAETPIQYDLYRIPFNRGQGGTPEPIAGASNNGMSNTFPKVSPDGKWIVFVKCRNGQLMRPDSKLWIVPAEGGTARLMRCNTWRMNSWHSFSPNNRWMVFSSKANTPYTQMFLTHIDEQGNDSPAILIPNSTAANRAVNLPEFVNIPYEKLVDIAVPALQYRRDFVRGVQLADDGHFGEALVHLNKAIESQPDFVTGRIRAADMLSEKGMLEEATAYLADALKIDPAHVNARCRLAEVLERRGMLEEAMAHYETALKLDALSLEAHVSLGKIYVDKGMLEEATTHFLALLKVNADDPFNHFDLAWVLLKRGMRAEAIEHLEKAVELDPGFAEAHLMLGRLMAKQEQFESAIARFRKVIGMDPGNVPAIHDLAWLLATCSTLR